MNMDRCVLVAEDDENDSFFLQRAFTKAEVKNPLYFVHDGQQAIEYLSGEGKYSDRQHYPLPCLMMLDLKMPHRTGMEVLLWMQNQKQLQSIPVIVFSSSLDPVEMETAYQRGASAFVSKPYNSHERIELIKTIRAFWLTFNQLPFS